MAKMTRKEAQLYAREMRVFAKVHLADGLECWKGEEDMIEMVRGDAADYREIAKLLRAFKIEEALEKSRSLDTAAREEIPETVWDAMASHCDPEYDERQAAFAEQQVQFAKEQLERLIIQRDLLNEKIARLSKK